MKRASTSTKRINGAKHPRQRYFVRKSGIHGRGVFAAATIGKGTRIVEYKGERLSHDEVDRRYLDIPEEDNHTFLFEVDEHWVIDASVRGNAARWINHGCNPNCEAVEEDGHIFIEATRKIGPGEELTYDYNITLEERHTPHAKSIWSCRCGAKGCRGTILARKR